MPDEADSPQESTPAPEQAAPDGTPAPESTDDSTAQTTTDWQSRYENQQGALTQAQQEAAELRSENQRVNQIIDLARQGNREAIEWLELELADEDLDEDEEQEFRDPRVDRLLQEQEEREYHAELAAFEKDIEGEVASLIKSNGLSFDDEEHEEAFVSAVFAHLAPNADNSGADTERAFKAVTGLTDRAIKSYINNKRKAPLAPSGSSASHQPDLDDDKARRAWLHNQAQQLSS